MPLLLVFLGHDHVAAGAAAQSPAPARSEAASQELVATDQSGKSPLVATEEYEARCDVGRPAISLGENRSSRLTTDSQGSEWASADPRSQSRVIALPPPESPSSAVRRALLQQFLI